MTKQQQPFIMLIMNCKKYAKKALFQKNTWLKQIPDYLKYYHVIGDEHLEGGNYRFDDESNILWVKTPDDYNSLPKKVICAYEAVSKTFDFQYLFKTDDDQILVNKNFFNVISQLVEAKKPKTHYGGFVVTIQKNHLSNYHTVHPELPKRLPLRPTYYCSGRFYFLSNEAIQNLLLKKLFIMKEYFEDYAIGYYMDEIFKKTVLHIATNNYFTDIELSDFPRLVAENKI
jgi:hypothetical protein